MMDVKQHYREHTHTYKSFSYWLLLFNQNDYLNRIIFVFLTHNRIIFVNITFYTMIKIVDFSIKNS